eukprot:4599856-Ditylum_brightwellii.AAC.1
MGVMPGTYAPACSTTGASNAGYQTQAVRLMPTISQLFSPQCPFSSDGVQQALKSVVQLIKQYNTTATPTPPPSRH